MPAHIKRWDINPQIFATPSTYVHTMWQNNQILPQTRWAESFYKVDHAAGGPYSAGFKRAKNVCDINADALSDVVP